MNIVQVVPSLKPCGPVNVASDLVKVFSEKGHHCYVIYFDETIKKVNFNAECFHISEYHRIPWDEIDIIHAHGYRPSKFLLKIKRVYPQIKRVSTLHNYVFQDFKFEYGFVKGFFASLLYCYVLRKSGSAIVTLSKDALAYYKPLFPNRQLFYSYNSRRLSSRLIDESETALIEEFRGGGILLGVVSVLTKRKNISSIIRALPLLPNNMKLCIVGDGKEKCKLEKLVNNLRTQDRVLFLGSREDASRYMKYFDAYLLTSKSEGFPLSIIEAAASKCRIVSYSLPMIMEVFKNKTDIILCEKLNPVVLSKCIVEALNMPNLGINAYKTYLENFTLDELYYRHMNIYNSIINK
ncbi:MAG: glycosyltransferase family 4 protein [Turicibacter sp.]|nr:glycosyltransferase family 4 protein [Turicibacter sp.]